MYRLCSFKIFSLLLLGCENYECLFVSISGWNVTFDSGLSSKRSIKIICNKNVNYKDCFSVAVRCAACEHEFVSTFK